jgi:NAD(P)-dependent dehydrogenase (short-subunit alcohol dehydrogenase family)
LEKRNVTSSLEGRIAVVTGGASGIGEACARELASRGARVVVADINEAQAQAVAGTIPHAVAARLDVTRQDDTEALAERIDRDHGPAAIVVTSAGVLQRPLPPEDLPMEVWDHVIAVDQRGVYVSCVAFGRRMARRGSGVIVNIASIAGIRSMPLHAYAPAKAAVIGITQALAAEWGRSGVRVNAIAPGFVMTPALQAAVDAGQRDPAALAENSALGRLVGVNEIAKACGFLASDDASAITGVTLPVDAGWLVAGSWHSYGGLRPKRE